MSADRSVSIGKTPFWILLLGCHFVGCDRPKRDVVTPPRAVSVLELSETDPAQEIRLPGSVAPWKREKVAFQVGGRVAWVIGEDRDVKGPEVDEAYLPSSSGELIARLDKDRYQAAMASATANVVAANALVEATRVQATQIVEQEMETARIERERTKSQLDRVVKAAASNAVAQSEVDNAKAAYNTSLASYQKVLAKKTTLENELKVNQARLVQSEESVNQAKLDLEDTELFAVFEGRISETHVTPGTIVAAGTPVATLMALDPVKIEVTVSAARDRQIKTNDEVLVHTEASPEPISAIVYQKSSAASATTRTFTLTLLCRNKRIVGGAVSEDAKKATPIGGLMRPQQFDVDGNPTWFIEERSIQTDENGGHFAWRVISQGGRSDGAPMDTQRVPVKLGEKRKELLGLFKFRELIPEGEIAAAITGSNASEGRWKMVLAVGVPKSFTGGKVIKTTRRWMLRPGDIVDVQLDIDAPTSGIYVPKRFIRVEGDKYFVFLVDERDGKKLAKKVPISIKGNVGPLQRIEGASIKPGTQMVTSGTHYLQDGTEIDIFEVTR